jgi:predicted Zn-dependent protease
MKKILVLTVLASLTACATSPTGRKQMMLVDDAQVAQLGLAAFDQIKAKQPISQNAADQRYVRCIADKLIKELPAEMQKMQWETVVFEDATPNAFALPGGKIGVNSGILPVANTEGELAAVMGHELSHVWSRHSAERVSQEMGLQAAMQGVQAYRGATGHNDGQQVYALLGLGAQVGLLLPFSRKHESEADRLGIELVARAGYDPRESVQLWQNMESAAKGGRPPEWLSTHPDPEKRMAALASRSAELDPLVSLARSQGKGPGCPRN